MVTHSHIKCASNNLFSDVAMKSNDTQHIKKKKESASAVGKNRLAKDDLKETAAAFFHFVFFFLIFVSFSLRILVATLGAV